MSLPDVLRFTRDEHGVASVNVEQRVVHHSPGGFEFGYLGSGPSDLALNIVEQLSPDLRERLEPYDCVAVGMDEQVKIFRGTVSRFTWSVYQDFKREFIASLPSSGGTLEKSRALVWALERVMERWEVDRVR